MSSKAVIASVGMVLAMPASPIRAASVPRSGGTIAVTSAPADGEDDSLARASAEAAATALGMRGFTILNDPAHAAYVAEVVASRTEVGTSVEKGRAGRTLATGAGVNIPIAGGKSVLVPLQRIEVEIRIRGRSDQLVFWHGAAVTVRSVDARNGGVDRLALELSQAALSSYPTQTKAAISVP